MEELLNKKKNRTLGSYIFSNILAGLIFIALTYLLVSFIFWSFDYKDWTTSGIVFMLILDFFWVYHTIREITEYSTETTKEKNE